MGRADDIEMRAEEYALRAIRLYRYLQKSRDGAGLVIGKQYLRSSTSIGANLIEARSGESRKDFVHKCSISLKEARESKYWLTLLVRAELVSTERIGDLLGETNQLIAILTRIITNTKARDPKHGN